MDCELIMMTFQLSNMIYQISLVEKVTSRLLRVMNDFAAIDHVRFISCLLRITVSSINNKEIRQEP